MGIGAGLFLFAIGAILRFAISPSEMNGVDLGVVGVILMIVGGIGMFFSLLFWSSVAPFRSERRDTVIRESDPHSHVV